MTKLIAKLLILGLFFSQIPVMPVAASEGEEAGEEAAPPEDPEMNDRTALLPKITFTLLLPKGEKRHVLLTAWLQMSSPLWAARAMQLESRITDSIIKSIYPYFYDKAVAGEGLELRKKSTAPAKPVTVPTYGGGKGKYDDAIAAYLAKQDAGGSAEELAHKELKRIIQKAANDAIGKEKVLEVTLKQVLQMDK